MPNAPKTPTRTIRVSEELWTAVKDKAQIDGRTVTDVIVTALKEYVRVDLHDQFSYGILFNRGVNMPKVIERNLPNEGNPIVSKVRKYVNLRSRIEDLTKEQSSLKTELSTLVDNEGTPDEKGHLWYSLPEEVDGYISLQRQRRVTQKLDEEEASRTLTARGLSERCYKMVPVLDESEVMACLYEGLLTEEEIDAMFPKSVSYAFIPSKS